MERKDIYIELLDCFMRGELPAEQEHELRTWFKQPEVREVLFQHYRHSSGRNSESDVPEYSEPDTCRKREEDGRKISSKATVSPMVAVCRGCCVSFRLDDFCSSIYEFG